MLKSAITATAGAPGHDHNPEAARGFGSARDHPGRGLRAGGLGARVLGIGITSRAQTHFGTQTRTGRQLIFRPSIAELLWGMMSRV